MLVFIPETRRVESSRLLPPNTTGNLKIAGFCHKMSLPARKKKKCRVFFVSSKKVYGRWKNSHKVVIDMGQKMARPERKRNSRKNKLTAKKKTL
jgi:hypothetical protein